MLCSRSCPRTPTQPRAHDADLVWEVQHARHVHDDPDCPVRFGTHDGQCDDISDGVSHNVPIYESSGSAPCLLRWVGHDLAEHSMKNLTEQGYSLTAAAEREFAWDVREKSYESQTETPSSATLNVSDSQRHEV